MCKFSSVRLLHKSEKINIIDQFASLSLSIVCAIDIGILSFRERAREREEIVIIIYSDCRYDLAIFVNRDIY